MSIIKIIINFCDTPSKNIMLVVKTSLNKKNQSLPLHYRTKSTSGNGVGNKENDQYLYENKEEQKKDKQMEIQGKKEDNVYLPMIGGGQQQLQTNKKTKKRAYNINKNRLSLLSKKNGRKSIKNLQQQQIRDEKNIKYVDPQISYTQPFLTDQKSKKRNHTCQMQQNAIQELHEISEGVVKDKYEYQERECQEREIAKVNKNKKMNKFMIYSSVGRSNKKIRQQNVEFKSKNRYREEQKGGYEFYDELSPWQIEQNMKDGMMDNGINKCKKNGLLDTQCKNKEKNNERLSLNSNKRLKYYDRMINQANSSLSRYKDIKNYNPTHNVQVDNYNTNDNANIINQFLSSTNPHNPIDDIFVNIQLKDIKQYDTHPLKPIDHNKNPTTTNTRQESSSHSSTYLKKNKTGSATTLIINHQHIISEQQKKHIISDKQNNAKQPKKYNKQFHKNAQVSKIRQIQNLNKMKKNKNVLIDEQSLMKAIKNSCQNLQQDSKQHSQYYQQCQHILFKNNNKQLSTKKSYKNILGHKKMIKHHSSSNTSSHIVPSWSQQMTHMENSSNKLSKNLYDQYNRVIRKNNNNKCSRI